MDRFHGLDLSGVLFYNKPKTLPLEPNWSVDNKIKVFFSYAVNFGKKWIRLVQVIKTDYEIT